MKTNMDHIGIQEDIGPEHRMVRKNFGPEILKNSIRNSLNLKIPYSLSHSDFEKTENERL